MGADAFIGRIDVCGAGRDGFGRAGRRGERNRFQNGGEAKKGDVLMKLDASSEEAQLHSAEADLELARADLERARDLAKRKVISKAELDAAESKFKQKSATVDQMRSMITKKEVRAPFDGQLGIRQVNVGQMINAGQQVVSLTSARSGVCRFCIAAAGIGEACRRDWKCACTRMRCPAANSTAN